MQKGLKQFDIVLVDLKPTRGSEQKGDSRPCVILQTNASQNYGKTTIIVPITSNTNKVYPFEVLLHPSKRNGITKKSKIKCDQIRVIDKKRIKRKIGKLDEKDVSSLDEAISVIFDLERNFRFF